MIICLVFLWCGDDYFLNSRFIYVTIGYGQISVKGIRNINTATGEVGKPIILGTVKLQLVLSKEQAQQALILQRSFELSNALNHK